MDTTKNFTYCYNYWRNVEEQELLRIARSACLIAYRSVPYSEIPAKMHFRNLYDSIPN